MTYHVEKSGGDTSSDMTLISLLFACILKGFAHISMKKSSLKDFLMLIAVSAWWETAGPV